MTAPHMSPADSSTLPPTDSLLSPLTGWTRAHWEALADRLLDGIVPYASPGLAQYRLPGRASHSGALSDGLEGFARSFLLAALMYVGTETTAMQATTRVVLTTGVLGGFTTYSTFSY